MAEGALEPYLAAGASNLASNVVSVERDSEPPRPVITTPGNQRVTDSRQISFSIEFGEPVRRCCRCVGCWWACVCGDTARSRFPLNLVI